MGIQDGDQLTLCAIARDGKFHYGRFICAPNDGDMTHSVTDTQYWNERNTNVSLVFAGSVLNMGLPSIVAEDTYLTAAGVILSRRSGGTWQRSNTEMIIWGIDFAGIGASMNTALYELETGQINVHRRGGRRGKPLEAAYSLIENEGYEPITNGLYGQFYDQYVFLRAIGISPDNHQVNCYYLIDGYVAAATLDATNHATGIYQTEFDQRGFEDEYQERPQQLFVTTTSEELNKVYLGKEIFDY